MKKSFIVAALFVGSQGFAQQDTTATMNPVVITATKFPQKQFNTGKVISVITKEQLEKSAARTISQLLNEQAGITINGALNSPGSNQAIYMRGAASGRTLVLLDGIPVNDPSLINNEFDLNLISVNNVERIEICRGAQSTLYGSDAIAGVVNIISLKNDISRPVNLQATFSAGNYSTYRGNLQLYGKKGKLSYTTRYAKIKTDGFSAAYDSSGKKDFDRDAYNSDAASAGLQFEASKELLFKSFLQYTRYTAGLDAAIFTDEKDFTVKNRNLIAGGGFSFIRNNLTIRGNYQYSDIYRNYLNDSIDKPGFTKYSTDDYYGRNQFVELYSSAGLGSGFTLLHGADYRYSSMNSRYYSLSSFGPFTTTFRDSFHSQASLYASLFFNGFNEKLNVELGGRLNVHSRYGNNLTYTFNPSFSITPVFRIFGNIATGFKAPTLYQIYGPYRPTTTVLQPEESTTFEFGAQNLHPVFQNRLIFFRRTTRNGIDFNSVTFKYYNFLKQTVNGFEWETALRPANGWNITGNYTFLDPEEISQSRVNFRDTTYSYLLRRPEHSANLSIGYQFTEKLFASSSLKYTGRRYDVGGYQKADVLLDSYLVWNAYSEYKLRPYLKIFADAQNISNAKFFDVRGYTSIPFLLNAGISFKWQ